MCLKERVRHFELGRVGSELDMVAATAAEVATAVLEALAVVGFGHHSACRRKAWA